MALRCAIQLGIPTAIHHLGGAASLPNLGTALSSHHKRLHSSVASCYCCPRRGCWRQTRLGSTASC
ncbi:unnamed protein product [Triticum turgidum subsp. durum]|uniref:Uncharacterized protein n=1 Tax=Triticum turgidum subsp. durum TaxID=4567 RepID=A0A9R1RWK7_TRITD|nr:unnamed protein product [Triticum turgidum subsp. durum]